MYKFRIEKGKVFATNTKDKNIEYEIPFDDYRELTKNNKQGSENILIHDSYFESFMDKHPGIKPKNPFDMIKTTEDALAAKEFLKASKEANEKLRNKYRTGEAIKVNRDKSRIENNKAKKSNRKETTSRENNTVRVNRNKSRLLKKVIIKATIGLTTAIMAISGIGALKNKLSSKDKNNSYTIEHSIDDNKLTPNDETITPENENNNTVIIDSNSDDTVEEENMSHEEDIIIDNQDESTEYYYNLDGEVDRQNWENAMMYEDNFKKAGEKFGIDYRLLMAIACQESSGIHENSEYSYGIMHVERVHKDEKIYFNNMITGEVESMVGTEDVLNDIQGNIDFAAGLEQNCLNTAYREGCEEGILKNCENIPASLHGYNMGVNAEKKMIDNYAKSGDESYNYFIRSSISANIDDENLVWHLKYPALVFNERNEEEVEYWAYCKDSKGNIVKVTTKAINESKMFSASMKR